MKCVVLLAILALSLNGCVTISKYHSVQVQLKAATDQLATLQKTSDLLKADNGRLETSLKDCKSEYAAVSAKVRSLVDGLLSTLDEADKAFK
jgi:PBP1b-binding outer membrane lipoprotein LpoB